MCPACVCSHHDYACTTLDNLLKYFKSRSRDSDALRKILQSSTKAGEGKTRSCNQNSALIAAKSGWAWWRSGWCKTLLIARCLKELMTCRPLKIDPGNCAPHVHEYRPVLRFGRENSHLCTTFFCISSIWSMCWSRWQWWCFQVGCSAWWKQWTCLIWTPVSRPL